MRETDPSQEKYTMIWNVYCGRRNTDDREVVNKNK